ncbi:oligoribonuclease [Pistricoccus aurantiacus]|uniref:Oligoribonuclease n=1 Tax=Pistricoccus aurantiacus TaxID=1883414 RepID=A0A5B8SVM4_9GAMM|nr:oligoribonuclease [Pistricoccus aurantiacus]QEA40501.1 oligoribonuclease [Pistricoccus aurantiacus]
MTTPVKPREDLLIWIDLEMTGLDPSKERIIEVATLITDNDLNLIAEGPVIAVHQSNALLQAMDKWNQKTHGESGLVERVRKSDISPSDAERRTLDFLKRYTTPGSSPMCGNSVHQDRRFLEREMPELLAFFHYRNLDVSTVKELAKRWNPQALKGFEKRNTHQALDDIRESLAELAHYRKTFLNCSAEQASK